MNALRLASLILLLAAAACGSSDSDSNGGTAGVPCRSSGSDDDCTGQTTAKFDCSSAADQKAGFAAGCVAEHPNDTTDFDLCCPAGTQGTAGNGKTIPCTGPTTDGDCTGLTPNKFDCASASASASGKAAGCVSEHPEDSTELDVCCPAGVTGMQ